MNISNLGTLRAFIEGDTKKLTAEFNTARSTIKGFGRDVPGWVKPVSLAMVGMGTVVTGALTKIIFETGKYGDSLDKMSLRTGVAVSDLSELSYAVKISGSDVNALETSFRFLARRMDEYTQGIGVAKDAFDKLGISVTDSTGQMRPSVDVMKEVADGIVGLTSESERVATAMDIFGARSGPQLLPLLKQGSAGIEELTDKARALGLTVATEAATAAAEFTDRLTDLKESTKMAGFELGQVFLPAVTKGAEKVADAVGWFNRLSDSQQKIIGWGTASAGGIAMVTGGMGLLLTQLPKMTAGWAILKTSAVPQIAAVTAAVAALGWAYKETHNAYIKYRDGILTAEERMEGWEKAIAGQVEAFGVLTAALDEAVVKGYDAASVTVGELDVDIDKLSKTLGVNVTASRNAAQLIDILGNSIDGTHAKVKSLSKETSTATETTKELTKTTINWRGALSAMLDPLGSVWSAVGKLTVRLEDLSEANLDFLAAYPEYKQTTKDRTDAIHAEAEAFRDAGIAVRDMSAASKRTPEEIKAMEDWEAEQATKAAKLIEESQNEIDLANRMAQIREENILKDEARVEAARKRSEEENAKIIKDNQKTQKWLAKIEEDARRRTELNWLEMADITSRGVNAVNDAYYGIVDMWYTITGQQRDFHDTWLSDMVGWINRVKGLLDNLVSIWQSAALIISKFASISGGGGDGIAQAVSAAGGLGGVGQAAGGVAGGAGILGKILSGVKAAGGAIANAPWGAIGGGAASIAGLGLTVGGLGYMGYSMYKGMTQTPGYYGPGSGYDVTEAERRRRFIETGGSIVNGVWIPGAGKPAGAPVQTFAPSYGIGLTGPGRTQDPQLAAKLAQANFIMTGVRPKSEQFAGAGGFGDMSGVELRVDQLNSKLDQLISIVQGRTTTLDRHALGEALVQLVEPGLRSDGYI